MTAVFASVFNPTGNRSVDDLDRAICHLVRQMNAECYAMLELVREFDERLGFAKWSFKTCAEWLAWRCGLSLSAAREKVRTAHALPALPEMAAAFSQGRLSYSKVRALTRVADARNEDLLLAYALDASVVQVEERCRQIRNVSPESVDGARRAWERRSATFWRDEARGTLRLTVELPIEEGDLIARAIDLAVASGEANVGLDPLARSESRSSSWCAQQADALVAVVKAYLDGSGAGGEHTSTADHYQILVHVDESALRGEAGRSDLPLETVRRLCCDGSVVTVAEDEAGEPLDVGRKHRTVSTALKRALHSRDRGCSFPGCQRRRYLDAHHVVHWADGGETSLENLALLCTFHHRVLHEGGFKIERSAERTLRFLRPDGRAIPSGGYRLDDFTDDGLTVDEVSTEENPSREGFPFAGGATSSQPADEIGVTYS
jgi:hypothetical protein